MRCIKCRGDFEYISLKNVGGHAYCVQCYAATQFALSQSRPRHHTAVGEQRGAVVSGKDAHPGFVRRNLWLLTVVAIPLVGIAGLLISNETESVGKTWQTIAGSTSGTPALDNSKYRKRVEPLFKQLNEIRVLTKGRRDFQRFYVQLKAFSDSYRSTELNLSEAERCMGSWEMMTLGANEYLDVLTADAESIDAFLDSDLATARVQRAIADRNVVSADRDTNEAEKMLEAGLGEGRNFDGVRKGSPEHMSAWPTNLADGNDKRFENSELADASLRESGVTKRPRPTRPSTLDDPIVRSVVDRHPELEKAFRNHDTNRLEQIFQSWALTGEVDMETIRYIRKRLDN